MPVSRLEDRIAREYREGLDQMRTSLEKDVRAGKISNAQRAKLLQDWNDYFPTTVAKRQNALAEQTMDESGKEGLPFAAGSLRQGIRGVGSSMTLGLTDKLTEHLGGDPEQNRISMEAEAAAHPVARQMTEFGGNFVPSGAPARIGAQATRLTGRAFLKPAIKMAARDDFIGAVGKIGIEGLRGALAGSGGAAGTVALEGLLAGKDRDQITSDIWMPLAFGTVLGGAGGSIAGFARVPHIDKEGMNLAYRLKKVMPGFMGDPSLLRQGSGLQSLFRYSANAPIGRRLVHDYYKKAYLAPLRSGIASLTKKINGSLRQDLHETAEDVRKLVGTEATGAGAYQRQISRMESAAFASEGDKAVPPALMSQIITGMARMDQARSKVRGTLGARGTGLSDIMALTRDLEKASRTWVLKNQGGRMLFSAPQVTVQELENLKQSTRAIAKFDASASRAPGMPNYSSADVREARRMYALINQAERNTSSVVDNVLNDVRPLRKLQAELRPLSGAAENADDRVLLDQLFTGKNPLRRLGALHQVQAPEARQRLAGQYFSDFLEQVVRGKDGGRLLTEKVDRLFKSHGRWNAEMFDSVVGAGDRTSGRELRETVMDIVEGMDRAQRALGSAEGSQTASYLLSAGIEGGVVDSVRVLSELFQDPRIVLNRLQLAGGFAFATTLLKQTLDGKIAVQLDKLARGQSAAAMTRTPTALSQAANRLFETPFQAPEEVQP